MKITIVYCLCDLLNAVIDVGGIFILRDLLNAVVNVGGIFKVIL